MELNKDIVKRFISLINEHKADALLLQMTDDFLFIDPQGNEVKGKSNMRIGCLAYFELFPDYKIEVLDIIDNENLLQYFALPAEHISILKLIMINTIGDCLLL
jgi:ketosteroid isomerase-like protein